MHPRRRAAVLALCAIASGVLYAACYPPTPVVGGTALAWVALVPLFRALRAQGPAAAAGLAALWAFTATALSVRWVVPTLIDYFHWSGVSSVSFLLLLATVTAAPFFALTFALAHSGHARPRGVSGCVLLAAAFVAGELLRSHIGLRSPWATLGVTQVESVHVRQLADLTGVYGVSGVVAFVNAALAELLGRSTRAALRPVATAAALLVFVVGYGALRIHQLVEPPGAAVLDVALVQGNLRSELRWKRTHASRVLRLYGRLTREAILAQDERPDLVIWPENALQTAVDDPSYGPPLMALARSVPLLIGAPRHTRDESGRREYNSAHFIHPGGHVASYDKRRLLPFSESRPLGSWASFGSRGDLDRGDWSAGRQPGVFALDGHGLGVLICMDALYPELAREAVEEGADVLVNISNDGWFVGPGALEQHFAHVVFRAIETRRPLLRIAPTGVTAVVSPAGDVVARLESDTRGTLRVQVHVPSSPPSLYAQIGDAFSIACLLVCSMPLVQRGHAALPPHIGDGSHSVRSPRRIA